MKGVEIATTAKDEISNFLASKEAGIASAFKRATLVKAAEDIFTANGQPCPIAFMERDGKTYIINREIVNSSNVSQ